MYLKIIVHHENLLGKLFLFWMAMHLTRTLSKCWNYLWSATYSFVCQVIFNTVQRLDRSSCQPLKTSLHQVCRNYCEKIIHFQSGELYRHATSKATRAAGFLATGIYPFDRSVIADHVFAFTESCSCVDCPYVYEQRSVSPQPSSRTFPNGAE
jgi:hypothetical protein